MLKIQEVSVYDIRYKDMCFPIIEAVMHIDGNDEPCTDAFATNELGNLLLDENGDPKDREAKMIDDTIYAFVPDDLPLKTEQEIIDWIEKNID